VDSEGNIYVSDMNNHRVQKFTGDGKFITKWGSEGSSDGQFLLPLGIGIDSLDNLYIVDQKRSSVEKFASDGKFIQRILIQSANDSSSNLEDIELDKNDIIYVTDRGEHNIKIYVPVK
jgi:tripartite motif-containing protein 71